MSQTLLDLLIARFPQAKKQTLRRMVEDRRVQIDGTPARSMKQIVEPAQKLTIRDKPKSVGFESMPAALSDCV